MGPGIVNLFAGLAGAAGKAVADAWTVAMLGLWNAGLWMLRLVLNLMDAFLTPDLSEDGPGAQVYRVNDKLCAVIDYNVGQAGTYGFLVLVSDGGTIKTGDPTIINDPPG